MSDSAPQTSTPPLADVVAELDTRVHAQEARRDGFSFVSFGFAAIAVVVAVVAMALAGRAISDAKDAGGTATAGPAAATATVTLSEFKIDPAEITVAAGGSIDVMNMGNAAHNLTVVDQDLATPDINAGESATLALGDLEPGDYTVICSIAGHEAAGMKASLTVTEGGGGGTAAPSTTPTSMGYEEMDQTMHDRAAQFPAKTEGTGAVDLEPKVLADGTKVFELTASIFDWEVEPGKVVKAWGYNKMVPGPTIRTEVGDHVQIIVHNELPESTALHSHGFTVPNAMDGVPDITQKPIKPGESFTYDFTIREPMVGMYHSHHDAQVQVPNGMLGAFYAGHMPLPAGVTPTVDVPMVLNDAGAIGFSLNAKSFPATAPIVAKVGDWVKVDYMNEGMRIHPMHLHGMPQLVIAKDGYPLATPQLEDTVTVAPGERVSVLVHATEVGAWAWHCHVLNHAERADGMYGMVTALVVQ
jgi:FtsP/CotA-like multicopper oxidase with cupredoxin domain